ncbi:MAG: metallophosphoesterase [Deltaproteobacteria bacterium]|nr:MAG: metallophosphoesterase [Deltaproteobacteria bacterium]
MRIGILSDIHANLPALEAAFALLHEKGVDRVVCAGDLVEKGDHGDEVVAMMEESWIPCVMGNHDENAVMHAEFSQEVEEVEEEEDAPRPLKPSTISYLRGLPSQRRYEWEGLSVLIAHATPASLHAHLFRDPREGLFAKSFKKEVLRASIDILILGHTHAPLHANFRGTHIFNPGSVCLGRNRDSHTCAILELPACQFEVFHLGQQKPYPHRIIPSTTNP